MFSALVPIAHVCRGNIATNAVAIAAPSVRWAAVAFPELPNSACRAFAVVCEIASVGPLGVR